MAIMHPNSDLLKQVFKKRRPSHVWMVSDLTQTYKPYSSRRGFFSSPYALLMLKCVASSVIGGTDEECIATNSYGNRDMRARLPWRKLGVFPARNSFRKRNDGRCQTGQTAGARAGPKASEGLSRNPGLGRQRTNFLYR